MYTSLLSNRNNPLPQTRNWGISPYSQRRKIWEYFMFILSFFVLWEIPFECFFNPERPFLYILPSLIVDCCFFADIFITQRTGVVIEGVLHLDKETISKQTPKWRTIIYWLSPWPYYLIGWFSGNSFFFRSLLVFKCLRFFRMYDAYKVIHTTLVYISPASILGTLFLTLFTVLHISACIFWYIGSVETHEDLEYGHRSWLFESGISEKPLFIQYFHSIYFISTTILTIGYGDLHPYTFREVCAVIMIEFVGVFCYNYVVSVLISFVTNPTRNSFLSKFQRIYYAFKYRGVSKDTMDELLRYFEYVWEKDRDRADFYETASKLPETLQKQLSLALHLDVFTNVNALRDVDDEVLERISVSLKPRIFAPGDFIIKASQVSSRIFFITEGKINIINQGGAQIATLDSIGGCVLGEDSMISCTESQVSAIAETYVEASELLKEDFDKIVFDYPQLQERFSKKKQPLSP